MKETKIDILGLVETNVSEKEGKLILKKVQGYHRFWSLADKNKVKGSGVVSYIEVIMIYQALSDHELEEKIVKYLKGKLSENKGKHTKHHIIIGDFNQIAKNVLDKKGKRKVMSQKKSKLMDLLVLYNYKNIFRELNLESESYTWKRNEQASRIDYIWTSSSCSDQEKRRLERQLQKWKRKKRAGLDKDLWEQDENKNIDRENPNKLWEDKEEEDIRKDIKNTTKVKETRKKKMKSLTAEQKQICIEIIKRRELSKHEHIQVENLLLEERVVGFWKTLIAHLNLLFKQKEKKRIRGFIETRYNMIVKDQKKMLASLLNRPSLANL
ncbi:hypothetical protein C2G38_2224590 [Gigaspora rosea]|uniref:Endonuclease/exonuclease/phosphatase n=1 Tax=Gigaspora rosea TaxID=44941 RepID=A0A397U1S0_9GLOM|nr:hypothetical protein C2G38_2224590 [Gigaspora rosea]